MRATLILCEHGDLSPELVLNTDFGNTEIGSYILTTENEEKKIQRMAAYLTLRGVLAERGVSLVDIRHGERGKPIAVTSERQREPKISISYEKNLVAVAVSDAPVGVDIEHEMEIERAERIDARFLVGRGIERAALGINGIDFIIARLSECGELLVTHRFSTEHGFEPGKENSPIYVNDNLHIYAIDPLVCTSSKWTSLEALLKLSGGGFADFLNTGEIAEHSRLAGYKIKANENILFLTVAASK